jgi:glyoxylase-like metal-dependent hydrolase (beta-lactamase superfamily II)
MSAGAAPFRAIAVRYAERATTFADVYYRWSSYGEPDGPLEMSYYFWVLHPAGDPGAPPIVIDTGFEPARGERMGRRCLCTPAQALARLQVDPADVQRLVISHMHYDHIGNLDLFARARISISETEFRFWTENPVADRGHFASHTDSEGVRQLREAHAAGRVDFVGPRAEIAPGLVAVEVGGHAPGELVFEVVGENGSLALAADAVHYEAELDSERPFAIFSDLGGVYRGYDTIRSMMSAGATLIAGHDPVVMDRFPRVEGAAGEIAVCLTEAGGEP